MAFPPFTFKSPSVFQPRNKLASNFPSVRALSNELEAATFHRFR